MNEKPETTEKKGVELKVANSQFIGNVVGKLMTSSDLSRMIAKVFNAITPCCRGVKITPMPNGQLTASISFEYVNENDIPSNMVSFVKNMSKERSTITIVEAINGVRESMHNYELTDDAKGILRKLIPTNVNGKPVFRNVKKEGAKESYEPVWDMVSYDSVYEADPFRRKFNGIVYVTLDLRRVLTMIYGTMNEEGDRLQYDAVAVRPIQMTGPSQYVSAWLINISQFNSSEIQKIAEKTNIIVGNNDGYINC